MTYSLFNFFLFTFISREAYFQQQRSIFVDSESELTFFEQPTLSVGIEEGVCEIVAVILWDFEWFVMNTLVQFLCVIQNRVE